jgi:hypothetical protein
MGKLLCPEDQTKIVTRHCSYPPLDVLTQLDPEDPNLMVEPSKPGTRPRGHEHPATHVGSRKQHVVIRSSCSPFHDR